ncbi:hypothetical protein FA95DRAFT_1500442 [Auriscalpium vulgare]|uniref:Uncharacterized protein n=1 Tax=Auriscalpium vulgare TaxID=40419 RepID=A0ACB8RD90_9AGAM|nr:hypothetical protein FA95DRAFT_1500442 [Auriscalpium vulgare]
MTDLSHSHHQLTAAPEHLNNTGCRIQHLDGKGRGVFASRAIPAQSLIEISPVLLFSASEYEAHGKHTVLDHYTFKWRDGRMALALGLGSLFNHSESPNVSYVLDRTTESIRYTTTRAVKPDEELCIFYGSKLWFDPVDRSPHISPDAKTEDGWGGLSAIQGEVAADEDPLEIIPENDLPFTRIKVTSDHDDEDTEDSVRTVQVWAVDIPDARHITVMLKWLKQSGYDTPTLSHLKRIRKSPTHSTLLLTASPDPPTLPSDPTMPLSDPYEISVPASAALTPISLKLKTALWPTVFAPPRKGEPEQWSRARLRWAQRAMQHVADEARRVGASGELPIVSYVPAPFDALETGYDDDRPSFIAHDIRTSAHHPLRHSAMSVIRKLADSRPRRAIASTSAPPPAALAELSRSAFSPKPPEPLRNGQFYLLTSLTLFTTHEPCLMCSMALLHSRVKEIFYLVPMPRTGGCGGAACVPKLEGVNHRYGIARWKVGGEGVSDEGLQIDDDIDA